MAYSGPEDPFSVGVPPLPTTIDPPFPIRWGWLNLLENPVWAPARPRVSSRPRQGLRKIDTKFSAGGDNLKNS
jgi:hypothetical protein